MRIARNAETGINQRRIENTNLREKTMVVIGGSSGFGSGKAAALLPLELERETNDFCSEERFYAPQSSILRLVHSALHATWHIASA